MCFNGRNLLEAKIQGDMAKGGGQEYQIFHKMVNVRTRKNFLSKVNINGDSLTSAEDIKDGVCRAYRTLLSGTEDWRPRMGNLQFRVLGTKRARSLFQKKKVFEALCSLSGDKAPGPDGFTMAF